MASLKKALATIEQAVGYPVLEHRALRDSLVEQVRDEEPAAVIEKVIDENVHWKGEQFPGDYHEDPEFFAEYVKTEQAPDILARHFAGLFSFAQGVSGEMGDNILLADLNPRPDALECPVYRQLVEPTGEPIRGKITPWYLFTSPAESDEFYTQFYAVKVAFEEEQEVDALGADLVAKHPRACRAYAQLLKQYGVQVPKGAASFPDPDGERLLAVHDALLPIAEVLVARAKGAKAPLGAADAKRCAAQADAASSHPPAVLLALLVPALSGRTDEAKKLARRIVDQKLGVALTRTWAEKVLRDEPPFGP